jgi:uncharacterized iron-regulated membrane protein
MLLLNLLTSETSKEEKEMEITREENQASAQNNTKKQKLGNSLYRTVWRWHFYAGILFTPFLVILAVTGSVYLFKPQIEQVLYQEYYEVNPQGEKEPASLQIEEVKKLYPDALVTSYRPGETDDRSSEVGIVSHDESLTVFMNPYTGESMGTLKDEDRIMDKIEEIHGELMAGTLGDRIVELAACWAIVLIVTGLFLWFPKRKKGWAEYCSPDLRKEARF